MKRYIKIFTTLFLVLTTMPGLASIKSNVTGSDICENINCVQNKMQYQVEFTKPIKYISSLNYQDIPKKIRTDWENKCIKLVKGTKGAKQNVTVNDVVSLKKKNDIYELLCVLQCTYTKLDNKTCRNPADKKSATRTKLTDSIKPNEQIYIDEDLRKDEDILSDLENWQKKCTELLKKTTGDIESIEVKVASDNSSATCVIKCKDDATYDAVQNKCIKNTTYKVQIVDEVTGKEIPNITITGLPKNCTRDGNTIICVKTTKNPIITVTSDGYKDVKGELIPDGTRSFSLTPTILEEIDKTKPKLGNQIGVPSKYINDPIVTKWIDNANDAIDAAGGQNEVQKETSPDGKTIYYSAAITKCKDSNKVPNANGTECMDLPNQLTTASRLNPAVIKPGNISVKNPASVTQLKPAQIQQIQNEVQKTPTKPGNQIGVPNGLENIPIVTQWIDNANDAIDAAGGANEVQKETSPDGKTIYFSSVITECQNGKAPIEDGTKCPSDNTAQESKQTDTDKQGSPSDKGKGSNDGFTPIKVNLVDDKTGKPIAIDPESISGLPEKSYIEGNTIYVPTDKIPANGTLPINVTPKGYEGGNVKLPTNGKTTNIKLTPKTSANEQDQKNTDKGKDSDDDYTPIEVNFVDDNGNQIPNPIISGLPKGSRIEGNTIYVPTKEIPANGKLPITVKADGYEGGKLDLPTNKGSINVPLTKTPDAKDQKDTDKGKDSNDGFTPIKVNLVDDKTGERIAIDPESISGLPKGSRIEGNTIYVPTDKIPANGTLPINVTPKGYEGGNVKLPTNGKTTNIKLTPKTSANEQSNQDQKDTDKGNGSDDGFTPIKVNLVDDKTGEPIAIDPESISGLPEGSRIEGNTIYVPTKEIKNGIVPITVKADGYEGGMLGLPTNEGSINVPLTKNPGTKEQGKKTYTIKPTDSNGNDIKLDDIAGIDVPASCERKGYDIICPKDITTPNVTIKLKDGSQTTVPLDDKGGAPQTITIKPQTLSSSGTKEQNKKTYTIKPTDSDGVGITSDKIDRIDIPVDCERKGYDIICPENVTTPRVTIKLKDGSQTTVPLDDKDGAPQTITIKPQTVSSSGTKEQGKKTYTIKPTDSNGNDIKLDDIAGIDVPASCERKGYDIICPKDITTPNVTIKLKDGSQTTVPLDDKDGAPQTITIKPQTVSSSGTKEQGKKTEDPCEDLEVFVKESVNVVKNTKDEVTEVVYHTEFIYNDETGKCSNVSRSDSNKCPEGQRPEIEYQRGNDDKVDVILKCFPKQTYTGIITDENGEPLIGATIVPTKGDVSAGTSTDAYGRFTITTTDPEVTISYMGQKPKTLSLKQGENVIMLEEEPHELNEVRPIGYESEFSRKCNASGGLVTEINADDIDYMPNKEDLDFFNMTDEDWRKFYCDCTKSGKVYNKTTKECEEERNDLTGAVTKMITNFKKQVKSLKDKECPPQQQGQQK